MRAEINSKGRLTVIAESELEAYALAKWSEDHQDVRSEDLLFHFGFNSEGGEL